MITAILKCVGTSKTVHVSSKAKLYTYFRPAQDLVTVDKLVVKYNS